MERDKAHVPDLEALKDEMLRRADELARTVAEMTDEERQAAIEEIAAPFLNAVYGEMSWIEAELITRRARLGWPL